MSTNCAVRSVLLLRKDGPENSVSESCAYLTKQFIDNITHICSELEAEWIESTETDRADISQCHLGGLWVYEPWCSTRSSLWSWLCHLWTESLTYLDNESCLEGDCWNQAAINNFLKEVKIPKTEILVETLWRPDLDPTKMDNYRSFLRGKVVRLQFQRVLEDMNYLEPWSSGYETETTFLIVFKTIL